MTTRFPGRPFTFLFALLFGILFSFTIIGTYGFYAIQGNLLANSGESLALAATDIADKIDRLLDERVEDIHLVAQSLNLRTQDSDHITSMLQHRKTTHPSFHSISFADSQGRIVASETNSFKNTRSLK